VFEIVASLFYLSNYHYYIVQLVVILNEIDDICLINIMEIYCHVLGVCHATNNFTPYSI
jgi:hypothetical protein